MSWNGVKKQSIKADIEAWCEEMGIDDYSINSQGEIDVEGGVNLSDENFKELPYKFGTINGYFVIDGCKNLISLKNCPNYVEGWFSCDDCSNLDSLANCPNVCDADFYCRRCKRKFTEKEVKSLCKVKRNIIT